MSNKKGTASEREFVNMSCTDTTHCERIAGSGNRLNAVCDAVLLTKDFTFLVEIKTTKEKVFYVRGHVKEQLQELQKICLKVGKVPILAVKFNYIGWYYVFVSDEMLSVLKPENMKAYDPLRIKNGGVLYA